MILILAPLTLFFTVMSWAMYPYAATQVLCVPILAAYCWFFTAYAYGFERIGYHLLGLLLAVAGLVLMPRFYFMHRDLSEGEQMLLEGWFAWWWVRYKVILKTMLTGNGDLHPEY